MYIVLSVKQRISDQSGEIGYKQDITSVCRRKNERKKRGDAKTSFHEQYQWSCCCRGPFTILMARFNIASQEGHAKADKEEATEKEIKSEQKDRRNHLLITLASTTPV